MTTLPAHLGGAPAFPEGLPLARPWLPDRPALAHQLSTLLDQPTLTNGPRVRALEEAVAERLGVPHVVAVSSCTLGLALTYQALSVRGPVLLPSFTFAASAHAVHWAGGSPTWVDVTSDGLTADPADVAAAATEIGATAVSATHIYGAPAQVDALEKLCSELRVPLVLDAAHALGSSHGGVPVGGFGTAEVFSLSPTKVAFGGEGGLVATRDAALAEQVRLGRDYGNPGDYDCRFPGVNARMSEMHATVAMHSISHLSEAVARRNHLVRRFMNRVQGVPGLSFQLLPPGDVSTYKDLTVLVDPVRTRLDAESLGTALAAEGIDSRRYYWPPNHLQRAYRHLAHRELPVTERVSRRVLSLPLWTQMTDGQLDRLADALLRILDHAVIGFRTDNGSMLTEAAR